MKLPAILVPLTASLLVGACASVGVSDGPAAPAPTFRVGDRWVYEASDGFRVAVTWTETHEVTAINAEGIAVRVTQIGPTVNSALYRGLGDARCAEIRSGVRRRNTRLQSAARLLRVSAVSRQAMGRLAQSVQRHDQEGGTDQPLRHRRRLGQGPDPGRDVRRDPAASADAPRRRGILALSDHVQLRALLRARGRGHGACGKRRRVPGKGRRRRARRHGTRTTQHAVLELTSYTRN